MAEEKDAEGPPSEETTPLDPTELPTPLGSEPVHRGMRPLLSRSRVLADRLKDAGHLTQKRLEEMDAEAREMSQDAFEFADASPPPDPESLYTHVYAEINPNGRLFFDGLERPGFAR